MKRKVPESGLVANKKNKIDPHLVTEILAHQKKFEQALQLPTARNKQFIADMKDVFWFFAHHEGLSDDFKMSFFRISQHRGKSLVKMACHPSINKLEDIIQFFEEMKLTDDASVKLRDLEIDSAVAYLMTHKLLVYQEVWINKLLRCVSLQKHCGQEYKLLSNPLTPTLSNKKHSVLSLAFTQVVTPFIQQKIPKAWRRFSNSSLSPTLALWESIFLNVLPKTSAQDKVNVLKHWIEEYTYPRAYDTDLYVEIKPLDSLHAKEMKRLVALTQDLAEKNRPELALALQEKFNFPQWDEADLNSDIKKIDIFQPNNKFSISYGTVLFILAIFTKQQLLIELFFEPTLFPCIQWGVILYHSPVPSKTQYGQLQYQYQSEYLPKLLSKNAEESFKKLLKNFEERRQLDYLYKISEDCQGYPAITISNINFPRALAFAHSFNARIAIIESLQTMRLSFLQTTLINTMGSWVKDLFAFILGYLDDPKTYAFQEQPHANFFCFFYPPASALPVQNPSSQNRLSIAM